jgi:hypothetical protein
VAVSGESRMLKADVFGFCRVESKKRGDCRPDFPPLIFFKSPQLKLKHGVCITKYNVQPYNIHRIYPLLSKRAFNWQTPGRRNNNFIMMSAWWE